MDVATKDDNRFARIALDFAHRLSSIFTLYAGAEVSRVAVDSRLTSRADELTLREWNIEGYTKLGFRLPKVSGLWGYASQAKTARGAWAAAWETSSARALSF